jgi:hypothetical protein
MFEVVVYVSANVLKFKYSTSTVAQGVNLTCGLFQIDNQLYDAIYPVVLQPTLIAKESNGIASTPRSVYILSNFIHVSTSTQRRAQDASPSPIKFSSFQDIVCFRPSTGSQSFYANSLRFSIHFLSQHFHFTLNLHLHRIFIKLTFSTVPLHRSIAQSRSVVPSFEDFHTMSHRATIGNDRE